MEHAMRCFDATSKWRTKWVFSVPYIILLFATNQGMLHHVHGRQIWREGHHNSGGSHNHRGQHHHTLHHHHGGHHQYHHQALVSHHHQYTSFEEFQRQMDNPFENNTSVNMTVPLGDTAFLRCKVRNLGERSISWIRRRDWHILSTGKTTYTNDERFHVLHTDGSDDWTLQIKFVQKRDNGTYECQVSTGTGIVSFYVHLIIAVPEAFILGQGEYHVEEGSTINLVCIVEKSPKPPEYIFWYHNDRMINYMSSPELTVHTEPGAGKTHSRLIIRKAHLSHSGNYTCKAANADPASILVFVSQASGFSGDQTAAIQHHKTASNSGGSSHPSVPSSSSSSNVPSSASSMVVGSSPIVAVTISPGGPSNIFVPLCVPFLIMPYVLAKVSLAFTQLFSSV
ncbi:unnamed protein product [Orchesella dallaii]|uniref:Ig-like domain-containing protein n=1 Tax=Orchesella dallaii TaxID=48710 RepID=A0ABP1QH40_9HEXA